MIPAHNEEQIIERCLLALCAQVGERDEILVVDNASSDATARLAARFPHVRVVDEPRPGVTFARTTGFDAASGDIVARIDADSVVAGDWIARIRRTFDRADVDVTIALLRTGHRLTFDPRLRVRARLFRSVDREKLARYYRTDGMTLARHGVGRRSRWVDPGSVGSAIAPVDGARG